MKQSDFSEINSGHLFLNACFAEVKYVISCKILMLCGKRNAVSSHPGDDINKKTSISENY